MFDGRIEKPAPAIAVDFKNDLREEFMRDRIKS
jgi:hypothetical protein